MSDVLAWAVLVAAGVMEAVWASALAESRGLRRVVPTLVFVIALAGSLTGLSLAMSALPTGTSYAVWVGVGAVLTAAWAVVRKQERLTVTRAVLLTGLVACIIGLKVVA